MSTQPRFRVQVFIFGGNWTDSLAATLGARTLQKTVMMQSQLSHTPSQPDSHLSPTEITGLF